MIILYFLQRREQTVSFLIFVATKIQKYGKQDTKTAKQQWK